MSYILCDMDCDQEINKSDVEEHCSDCLCVGKLVDEDQQDMPATKAWRSTSVVEGRGHPKTLSVNYLLITDGCYREFEKSHSMTCLCLKVTVYR